MIFLLLSIITSGSLVLFFKVFDKKGIHTTNAIAVNYITAALIGLLLTGKNMHLAAWTVPAVIVGASFFTIFNLVGISVALVGVAAIAVAQKMSLIIPVLCSLWFWGESIDVYTWLGITCALVAIVLVNAKEEQHHIKLGKYLWFPLIVFVGSGFADFLVKYTQKTWVQPQDNNAYITTIYAASATLGILYCVVLLLLKKLTISTKDVLGGVSLGIVNYVSMYAFVKSLDYYSANTAYVFTLNNIGIILFVTAMAMLFFKEKLQTKQWFGIALALLAVALMAL